MNKKILLDISEKQKQLEHVRWKLDPYKTGKVLINRKDNTYLTSIVNESDPTLNPYSGNDENLRQKFDYKFTAELENAIRFKDELEEWDIYRNMPLKDRAKFNNVYAPLFNKEHNSEGIFQFKTITSILKKQSQKLN